MKNLTAFCVLGLAVGLVAVPIQGDHCRGKHKNEPGCSAAEGVPYQIDYDFVAVPSATGPFDAVVECTNQYCEFSASGLVFDFHLPASFLALFTPGPDGEQQTCFGSDPTTVSAHSVFFRSAHGGDQWHAHVDFAARTKADEPVNYTFHLGGPCPSSGCPLLPQGSGWMQFFGGELLYVDNPSRGRGKRSPGCTCAWESCPEGNDWINLTLTEGSP